MNKTQKYETKSSSETYYNFDLKKSIRDFIISMLQKPSGYSCKSCIENNFTCGNNPLHLSFMYVHYNGDGIFLKEYAPSKNRTSYAQKLFLDNLPDDIEDLYK